MSSKIVVAGAGSVGCFVGGLLKAAGRNVSFLARPRIEAELATNGLILTDYSGMQVTVPQSEIEIASTPSLLSKADIVLVTVKSGATHEMARLIAQYTSPSAVIVSLQNGIQNADILRRTLPTHDIRAGMVPFNVVPMGNGHFHRASSGDMKVENTSTDVSKLLSTEHLETSAVADMKPILWGKLLINLNNALNAIADQPLYEQLQDRNQRKLMARQMAEALRVIEAEGIAPTSPAPVPTWLIPHILRLPTSLFRLTAKKMLNVDPNARLSMWQDLQLGRKTEIDELQGVILELGRKHGINTPVNQRTYDQIKDLEKQISEER